MTHALMATDPTAIAALKTGVTKYLDYLAANYAKSSYNDGKSFMMDGHGKLYGKIIDVGPGSSRSVHSFIVLSDTPKFKTGDILKAATWKAPAMNFARGSVFNPASYAKHSWTGAF